MSVSETTTPISHHLILFIQLKLLSLILLKYTENDVHERPPDLPTVIQLKCSCHKYTTVKSGQCNVNRDKCR